MEQIRLNKFLAERLGLSRREADDAIAAGKVTIDGKKAELGARLNLPDSHSLDKIPKVCYNGVMVPSKTDFLYLAFNKPVGYVCSRRAQGSAPTLYELLPKEYQKLKTVGRLDKDSSGLILLTNDGDFAFRMTHPKFQKEKIYEVSLDRPLEPLHQQMISDYGVMLDDGPSRFAVIKQVAGGQNVPFGDHKLGRSPKAHEVAPLSVSPKGTSGQAPQCYAVILKEGRNRQIRRTFAALGYRVTALHRTTFGPFSLSGLKPGEYTLVPPTQIQNML